MVNSICGNNSKGGHRTIMNFQRLIGKRTAQSVNGNDVTQDNRKLLVTQLNLNLYYLYLKTNKNIIGTASFFDFGWL